MQPDRRLVPPPLQRHPSPRRARRISPALGAAVIALAASLWAAPPPALPAAAQPPALTNAGFETAGRGATPAGWQVTEPASPGAAVVTRSAAVRHAGTASLLIDCPRPERVTVASEPIRLTVGRIYRLSGWIRTEGALSDPLSRYPTAVPATLSMLSFPFTNHAPAVGADSDWTAVSTVFIATKGVDRVQLHLGRNGTATGRAWFDELRLEEVTDIAEFIPLETVRWHGPAYRYDDQGWTFVHIEGEPYARGFQYGSLVADEIVQYLSKLAVQRCTQEPARGWQQLRFMADALFLRRFDEEFLLEMRGIADGAAAAGARYDGRPLDLVDIVTINAFIDLDSLEDALDRTPHALSGRKFLKPEEEMDVPADRNRCSSMVATRSATTDGRFVFNQLFMWNGYTGVHWNIVVDVQPSAGHRLVYQTFPGGIHSGADFYINAAGLVIGETTVGQTPFNAEGTPQANRIRKAAQYASSIDEACAILREHNNGLYTNDWTMADAKTDEGAVLLLGTHASRLWRTGTASVAADTPGGLRDFIWANNNNRDPAVTREYVTHPENAPYDLAFSAWNRDVAFNEFYRRYGDGRIDSIAAVNLAASSPINRAHACDAKVTTAEMAEQLVFLAHHGKATLRDKTVGGRWIPDLPGARPHLALGWTAFSPVVITERLHAARAQAPEPPARPADPETDRQAITGWLAYPRERLWHNTVAPATDADNWFVSGSAAYWRILRDLPEKAADAQTHLLRTFGELNDRYLYLTGREGTLTPAAARRAYDRYTPYQVPRIKGTYLLHQLRLLLGNAAFARVMDAVHEQYADTPMTTAQFIATAGLAADRELATFVRQWTDRDDLPDPRITAAVSATTDSGLTLTVTVRQDGTPYHFITALAIRTGQKVRHEVLEVDAPAQEFRFTLTEPPDAITFNPGFDIPVNRERFYTWSNFIDDFHDTWIVYGTNRQVEANHSAAERWALTLADAYAEVLAPVCKDCELSTPDAAAHDLIVLGSPSDNVLTASLAQSGRLPVDFGRNWFRWQDRVYADPDDGLVLVLPNPFNPRRALYLFTANSQLQLHAMTRRFQRDLGGWAVFKGDAVTAKGPHPEERFTIRFGKPDAVAVPLDDSTAP